VAQQDSPPRRSSRQPDYGDPYGADTPPQPGRRSHEGEPARGERHVRAERQPRPARQPRDGWQQYDAFAQDTESDAPPWAGPSVYPARPAGQRRHAAPGRAVEERPAERYDAARDARPGDYGADDYGADDYSADDYSADGYGARNHGADGDGAEGWAGDWAGDPGRRDGGELAGNVGRDSDRDLDVEPGAGEPGGRAARLPGRGLRPRRRSRAAATRLRKSRRRVYRLCGSAIVACVIAAVVALIVTHHSPKPLPYVTHLLAGEFKAVPNSCSSVSASVLSTYLPGGGLTKTDEISQPTQSQCSFTVDHRPVFEVLEVSSQQYGPFAAASGDGSASANAADNFVAARAALATPVKKSPLPPAQISPLRQLGTRAFAAFQSEHVTGIVTDKVTVVVLERNVIITVSLSGQETGHGFGPVPAADLQAGAEAAARSVLAKVLAEPTA
jgi:hypothetical protein